MNEWFCFKNYFWSNVCSFSLFLPFTFLCVNVFHLGSLHLYNQLSLSHLNLACWPSVCSSMKVKEYSSSFVVINKQSFFCPVPPLLWPRFIFLKFTKNGNINKPLMVTFVWKHIVWSQMQSQSVFRNWEFSKWEISFLFFFFFFKKRGKLYASKGTSLHPKSEELQGYVFF